MAIKSLSQENIPLLSFDELEDAQRAEQARTFGEEAAQEGNYFIFENAIYAMADCLRISANDEAKELGWDGYFSETAFSRLMVKLADNGDSVALGREF